jgi:hypothetical protein
MTTAVDVLFVVGGVRDVISANASIAASLDRIAKTAQTSSERSVKARIKGETDAGKAKAAMGAAYENLDHVDPKAVHELVLPSLEAALALVRGAAAGSRDAVAREAQGREPDA